MKAFDYFQCTSRIQNAYFFFPFSIRVIINFRKECSTNQDPIKYVETVQKFAILVAVALMVVIIFECILVALVVTNDKGNGEVAIVSDNEAELLKINGHLNASEVIHKNCRDIQEKNPEARSGLYLIRVVGKNHKYHLKLFSFVLKFKTFALNMRNNCLKGSHEVEIQYL